MTRNEIRKQAIKSYNDIKKGNVVGINVGTTSKYLRVGAITFIDKI